MDKQQLNEVRGAGPLQGMVIWLVNSWSLWLEFEWPLFLSWD